MIRFVLSCLLPSLSHLSSLSQVAEHLSARHMIGTSSSTLAVNLFTSHQARQEVWIILKDMESMRQKLELMRARMVEKEKQAHVLRILSEDILFKHEEEKLKTLKLTELLSFREEEVRYD